MDIACVLLIVPEQVSSTGSQDDDPEIAVETVHLNEELVQSLLSFIVAAAEACASASSDSIDLIDEHDARSILLGLVKEVSYSGSSDTYEHLNEVRTRDGEERHSGLSRCSTRDVGLSGTR